MPLTARANMVLLPGFEPETPTWQAGVLPLLLQQYWSRSTVTIRVLHRTKGESCPQAAALVPTEGIEPSPEGCKPSALTITLSGLVRFASIPISRG